MFDNHDAFFDKKLFRIVIDELTVDVDIGLVSCYFLNFFLHFHFFSL